ncbi:penicillin acylase family protein [Nocardioides kongjuensis]|uniref:penicillin acylase family protein n=1 Tax=Nocardioides kongjuensis TaxID=349522 RepID=UPI003CD08F4D
MRTPSHVLGDLGLDAILPLLRARTSADVTAAFTGWVGPVDNLVVGDRHGATEHRVVGRIPERDADRRWTGGWVADLPRRTGPVLVTANDRATRPSRGSDRLRPTAPRPRIRDLLDDLAATVPITAEQVAAVPRRRPPERRIRAPRRHRLPPRPHRPRRRTPRPGCSPGTAGWRPTASRPPCSPGPCRRRRGAARRPRARGAWTAALTESCSLPGSTCAAGYACACRDPRGREAVRGRRAAGRRHRARAGRRAAGARVVGDRPRRRTPHAAPAARPARTRGHRAALRAPRRRRRLRPRHRALGGTGACIHGPVARWVWDLAGDSRWVVPLGASGDPGLPHHHDQQAVWATGGALRVNRTLEQP